MKTTKFAGLSFAAVVLCLLAWLSGGRNRVQAPDRIGTRLCPKFAIEDVASIAIGTGSNAIAIAQGEKGWTIGSWFGYPADVAKVRANLLKLAEVKVGDVVMGVDAGEKTPVALKNAEGRAIAEVTLGAPRSDYRGRYALDASGETLLIGEMLREFDSASEWVDTSLFSGKRFVAPVDPNTEAATLALDEAKPCSTQDSASGLLYTTILGAKVNEGVYARVRAAFLSETTNAVERAAGAAKAKAFNDRHAEWTYIIPSYDADDLIKKRDEKAESGEGKAESGEQKAEGGE